MSNNNPSDVDPSDLSRVKKIKVSHCSDGDEQSAASGALPSKLAPKDVTHRAPAARPLSLPLTRPRPPPAQSELSDHADPGCPNPPPPSLENGLRFNPHPVHWHEDGNLLVELGGHHFKLFWTLMAKASTFFRKRYNSWKNDNDKSDLMTGKEVIRLDGEGDLAVVDFVELLDLMDSSTPYRLVDKPTLKLTLSILSASHALSFDNYFRWAKENLLRLWSTGEDFDNLVVIANHGPEGATGTLRLALACQIHEVLKPAVYSLLRLPSFGFKKDRRIYESDADIDLVLGREHLVSHWTATINRLRLPSCVRKPRRIATTSSEPPCTSGDSLRSDLLHYQLLYKDGYYHNFMNDPLMGLNTLRSRLLPPNSLPTPSTADSLRKRKRIEQSDLAVDELVDIKPVINVWESARNDGGYCEDCRVRMWDICSEAMEDCWAKLDAWAALRSRQVNFQEDEALEYR
ncbi:hypothetical protein BDN72DRAFT_842906 [Pluteus cervinus]|uniref:Uncharacterized protein n=1 Tax=Pluteus cervinus TaxID=181527 RepID=A0ACD3ARK0_9AGAR|nr:hypothetical protein BDN72DRAFT_842906 [Pluteus cervinus]